MESPTLTIDSVFSIFILSTCGPQYKVIESLKEPSKVSTLITTSPILKLVIKPYSLILAIEVLLDEYLTSLLDALVG